MWDKSGFLQISKSILNICFEVAFVWQLVSPTTRTRVAKRYHR